MSRRQMPRDPGRIKPDRFTKEWRIPMISELIIKFIVGGAVVSAFAALGDVFKPKSFAGLFGAAPSVALATLILAIQKDGPQYVSTEARSMMVGAVALI